MPKPWTGAEDGRLRELHAEGRSLQACAREMGRGAATVSRHAADLGLSWDRAGVRAAVDARRVDNKARRALLIERLLVKANDLLDQMDRPFLAFNFGGKENTYNEHQLDRPPTGDIKNLMHAASLALQRHVDLERLDSDTGADEARSMLTGLAASLEAAVAAMDDDEAAE